MIALVLAAGGSSRMGRTKQLLPVRNDTLLSHCLKNIQASLVQEVVCVLGANAKIIRNQTTIKDITYVINHNWQKGLSTSIVSGIKYILNRDKSCTSVLITLADQPMLDTTYYNQLITLYKKNPDKIIASTYDNRLGVPALFTKNDFPELLRLKGDKGAGKYLNSNLENLVTLSEPQKLVDIDTKKQYVEYVLKHKNHVK